MFHVYQRQTSVFQEVAALDFTSPGFNLTGDRPEQLRGIHVTESYFRLFGAHPMLGRTFTPQEDSPHGGKVVVLSYGLWQRRFGGDPAIAGKVALARQRALHDRRRDWAEIFSDPEADIWLPFQFDPTSNNMNQSFQVAGQLRAGGYAGTGQRPDEAGDRGVFPALPSQGPRMGLDLRSSRCAI